MHSIKRSFLWNTIGSTAYFAAQWLVTFLILRLAGLNASGLLSTAMTVTGAFISLSSYGMRYYQVSDVSGVFSQATYIKSRFLTCLVGALSCVGFSFMLSYSAEQRVCIILWLLYRMSEPFSDVYNGICQKHEQLYYVGISYLWRAAFTLFPFIALLLLTKNIYLTLFVMAIAMWTIVTFYDIPKARASSDSMGSKGVLSLLLLCAPLAVYKLLETASASIPKLFLERIMGADALAVYSPATSPVLLLQTGASFLLVPLVTVFASSLQKKDKLAFKNLILRVSVLILTMIPFGIVICLTMGKWGLSIISPELAGYDNLLIPMVVAATLTSLVMFLSMLLTVLRKLKSLIWANLVGLIAATSLSPLCIALQGLNGATLALCIALLLQACIMTIVLFLEYKKQF